MSENVEQVDVNIQQPKVTLNSVFVVVQDNAEPDIEISEEV